VNFSKEMKESLKLKEISYIHLENYLGGESISLITKGMSVIAVATLQLSRNC